MLVEAVRQLLYDLFEFLPSGGVDGCKSYILIRFDLRDYCFSRQMYAGDWAYRRGGEEEGKPRKEQEIQGGLSSLFNPYCTSPYVSSRLSKTQSTAVENKAHRFEDYNPHCRP